MFCKQSPTWRVLFTHLPVSWIPGRPPSELYDNDEHEGCTNSSNWHPSTTLVGHSHADHCDWIGIYFMTGPLLTTNGEIGAWNSAVFVWTDLAAVRCWLCYCWALCQFYIKRRGAGLGGIRNREIIDIVL